MNNKKFIFIGGLHRSGTTLIAKCLAQHPSVSAFHDTGVPEDEGEFLQSVYPTDNYYGGPGRFAFDENAHLTEKSPFLSDESKNRLIQEWTQYWEADKNVCLDKSPPTLIQSRFLQEAFADSYFVFIMRNPVATSIATHKWSGTGIYSLLHHWLRAHGIMALDLAHLNNVKVIRYESFVEKPEHILRQIESFIGLTHYKYQIKIKPGVNEKYFERWSQQFYKEADRSKPVPSADEVNSHNNGNMQVNIKRSFKRFIKRRLFGEERQLSHSVYESQDAISMFEREMRNYGYSMVNSNYIEIPEDSIIKNYIIE